MLGLEQAGVFLGATILIGFGIAFIGMVVIFLNNMIHKFWKPLNWFSSYFSFSDTANSESKKSKPSL
jgi:hypothetical protein